MITLLRDQLQPGKIYPAAAVNITIGSGYGTALHFAPTWEMVKAYKSGQLTADEYADEYACRLSDTDTTYWHWLHRQGRDANSETLTLLCYCPNGEFCHTHVLIDYTCKFFSGMFRDGRRRTERVKYKRRGY